MVPTADHTQQRQTAALLLAEECVHRFSGGAAGEVVQRNFDRRLGAVIAIHSAIHGDQRTCNIRGVAATQCRVEIVNCGDDALQRIAGHHGSGSRFAPSDGAVVRLYAYQHIVGLSYLFTRHDDGLEHRQADRHRLNSFDLHAGYLGLVAVARAHQTDRRRAHASADLQFGDSGLINNVAEHRDFLGHSRPCGISAFRPHLETRFVEFFLHFVCGENLECLFLKPLDELCWSFCWRQQDGVGGKDKVLVTGFLHGRHVGHVGPTTFARDRKATERACFYVRRGRRQ